jgi:hypothetical protein
MSFSETTARTRSVEAACLLVGVTLVNSLVRDSEPFTSFLNRGRGVTRRVSFGYGDEDLQSSFSEGADGMLAVTLPP